MKSHVQNIKGATIAANWEDSIPTYYKTYNDFKIGNFQQLLPFHYVQKDWMTEKRIQQMEIDYGR
jgi:hypothetical protein